MAKGTTAVAVAPPKIDGHIIDDFRRILSLGAEDPVPEKVLDLYRIYKRRVDVCSAGQVGPKDLILLTVLAGCEDKPKLSESEPEESSEQEGPF